MQTYAKNSINNKINYTKKKKKKKTEIKGNNKYKKNYKTKHKKKRIKQQTKKQAKNVKNKTMLKILQYNKAKLKNLKIKPPIAHHRVWCYLLLLFVFTKLCIFSS